MIQICIERMIVYKKTESTKEDIQDAKSAQAIGLKIKVVQN